MLELGFELSHGGCLRSASREMGREPSESRGHAREARPLGHPCRCAGVELVHSSEAWGRGSAAWAAMGASRGATWAR